MYINIGYGIDSIGKRYLFLHIDTVYLADF